MQRKVVGLKKKTELERYLLQITFFNMSPINTRKPVCKP